MSRFSVTRLFLFVWVVLLLHGMPWKLIDLGLSVMSTQPRAVRLISGNERYWDALDLESRLRAMGWHVQYVAGMMDDNLLGLTMPKEHTIFLEDSMGWNQRYDVLVHEGAHTLQPGWMNAEQGEVWAESVAYIVAGNRESHARYLSTHKLIFLEVFITEASNIYAAATVLEVQ